MADDVVLDVEVLEIRDGVVVAACHGEQDLATREPVGRLLTRLIEENDLVVVDVSDVSYVDASFLSNLLQADALCRSVGKRFRLQAGSAPMVRKALEYSGVLERIEHAETRDDVLRDVPPSRPAGGGS